MVELKKPSIGAKIVACAAEESRKQEGNGGLVESQMIGLFDFVARDQDGKTRSHITD